MRFTCFCIVCFCNFVAMIRLFKIRYFAGLAPCTFSSSLLKRRIIAYQGAPKPATSKTISFKTKVGECYKSIATYCISLLLSPVIKCWLCHPDIQRPSWGRTVSMLNRVCLFTNKNHEPVHKVGITIRLNTVNNDKLLEYYS